MLARFGGEEFVIFTLGGSSEDFLTRLEGLRRTVQESPVVQGPHSRHLTVSIGCHSAVPHPGETPGDFVRRADAYLYQAKRNGRNRVETSLGSEPPALTEGRTFATTP